MFSSTTEYALRAVVYLATHKDGACTAQDIARATKIPGGYVSKVLQDLARGSLVVSQRGPNGGFSLSRDATSITVLDVINAVGAIKRIRSCPLGIASHGENLCRLHQRLDDAVAAVERVFATSNIVDLLGPTPQGSACLGPDIQKEPESRVIRRRRRA